MSDNSKPTQNDALSFELTDWLGTTQRLDGAATPGPWETVEDAGRRGHITAPVDDPEEGAFVTHCEECMGYVLNAANAEWIAHARTALPAAVAALRAVADLHQPDDNGHCTECLIGHDGDSFTAGAPVHDAWPCATITAIQDTLGDHQ